MRGRRFDRCEGMTDVVMGKDAPMLELASPDVAERVVVTEPELSVVVASVNGWDVLEPTLRARRAGRA